MPNFEVIYRKNVYKVETSPTPFTFSLDTFKNSPFFDRPFGIITAWNPDNRTLSSTENEERNLKLYSDLYSCETLKAVGCYQKHCESGYLVFDISLDQLIVLGQKYNQFAVFFSDGKYLKYVRCEDVEEIVAIKRAD